MSPEAPTVTLVVNPSAGRGKAGKLLPRVVRELLGKIPQASLRVHQATSYDEARMRCIAAVEAARPHVIGDRQDCLVVMGGDGMMSLGLNAAALSGVPLGLIPAGTGNDFCRGVGVPRNALAATKVIAAGKTLTMDLAKAQGQLAGGASQRFVGSIVSTGYDSRVNRRTNAMSRTFGPMGYAYAALAELASFEPVHYELTIDGVPRRQSAMFVAVANAGYFGGGMRIAPDFSVTDGLLDIVIVHPVSRLTLARVLPSTFNGSWVSDPAVEQLRAQKVTIDGTGLYGMADGETLGPVPLLLEAVPEALTIYHP